MKEIKPGNIITKNFDGFPIYGIVLPKGKFLQYFENEKGKWPQGKNLDDKGQEFGYDLPILNEIIVSRDSFIKNKNSVGAKLFGAIYLNSIERKLSFEVSCLFNISGNFKPQDLSLINKIRYHCSYEFGAPSSMNPSFPELIWLEKYFLGEYQGKPTEEIRDSLSYGEKNLIDLLRDCKIPESI